MKQNRQQNAKYNSLSILFFNQCLRDYQLSSKFCIFSSFPKSFLIVGSSDCSNSYLNYSWGCFRWNLSGGHIRSRTRAVSCNMDENRCRNRKNSLLNKLVSYKIPKGKIAFFFLIFFFWYLHQMQGGEVVQQQHCLKCSWPSPRKSSSEVTNMDSVQQHGYSPLNHLRAQATFMRPNKITVQGSMVAGYNLLQFFTDLGSIHQTLQIKAGKSVALSLLGESTDFNTFS